MIEVILNTTGNQNKEELKGTPLLWNIKNIVFENPIEDVHTAV